MKACPSEHSLCPALRGALKNRGGGHGKKNFPVLRPGHVPLNLKFVPAPLLLTVLYSHHSVRLCSTAPLTKNTTSNRFSQWLVDGWIACQWTCGLEKGHISVTRASLQAAKCMTRINIQSGSGTYAYTAVLRKWRFNVNLQRLLWTNKERDRYVMLFCLYVA